MRKRHPYNIIGADSKGIRDRETMVDRNQSEAIRARVVLLDEDVAIVAVKVENPSVQDTNLVHFID